MLSSVFISCSKKNLYTCHDVNYDVFFDVDSGNKYCFPDGNFIEILEFSNSLCCFGNCIWEGEIGLHYNAKIGDKEYQGEVGSSPKTNNTIESKLQLEFKDIDAQSCGVENISMKIKVIYL